MKFISTRSNVSVKNGAEAIVRGLSPDGGLFVPESFPVISETEFNAMLSMSYPSRAATVIEKFLPELKDELPQFCAAAYSRFDGDPAPLVEMDDGLYMLELWHGPTHAFKDIALTLLPHLLVSSKKLLGKNDETRILVATSGDTGKAALEGFRDIDGTSVIVVYPENGVSNLQKLQMQTAKGKNVKVYAVKGNFDDAQTAVKEIFNDKEAAAELEKKNISLSSANSINFGRLVPQIAYYFSAYADLVAAGRIKYGDKVNFCVPTGNFGNILAGFYASKMGLPVNKLICASNINNILTDFIVSGEYDINREFYKTTSPSMDILISSNLERLLFELSGRDFNLTGERMAELKNNGKYKITDAEKEILGGLFYAGFAYEDAVYKAIDADFTEYDYIEDPHTAVAMTVYADYISETGDSTPTVVISTASPYKFASTVLKAIGLGVSGDEFLNLKKLEDETALPIPESLVELEDLEKLYGEVIEKEELKAKVLL